MKRGYSWKTYVGLFFAGVIVLLPFLIGIWTSLLPTKDIAAGNIFSTHISLNNYIAAIKTTPIVRYLWNSFITSLLTMVGQVILCSMSAYAFTFLNFKGRDVLFYIVIATMMIPFEAEVIPNFNTVKGLNLLNHYAVMIIPFLASAFGIFMLRQAFKQIPNELKECASIQGLSDWEFYIKVALPYCKIDLVTLAAYSFLTNWNEYLWPMLTTFSNKYRPVQIGLRQLQSSESFNDWGMIQASAVIIIIPTLIVLYLGQRQARANENEGAIK